MKRLLAVVSIPLLSMISGCSHFFDKHVEYGNVTPQAFPVLTALGYAPIAGQQGDNDAQRMLMAMKASKLDAYRELAERVYGQRIDASNTLQNLALHNDQLTATVQGVIRGARVVKTYAVDDVYITELELDFKEVYHVYQNIQPKQQIKSVKYY